MRCVTPITLYTNVDAYLHCDKLQVIVGLPLLLAE